VPATRCPGSPRKTVTIGTSRFGAQRLAGTPGLVIVSRT
jgi:hypothetical protein